MSILEHKEDRMSEEDKFIQVLRYLLWAIIVFVLVGSIKMAQAEECRWTHYEGNHAYGHKPTDYVGSREKLERTIRELTRKRNNIVVLECTETKFLPPRVSIWAPGKECGK